MFNPVESTRQKEYHFRKITNNKYLNSRYSIVRNDDIHKVPKYIWCFSKGLSHDKNNIANTEDLHNLIKGTSQNYHYLDKVKLGGSLKLINPSCVWSIDLFGPYKSNIDVPAPPSFCSAQTAADMVELYNMALLRDVPFHKYKRHCQVKKAVQDLNKLSDYRGVKPVTHKNLFRGLTKGDLKGPYVSQFLYLPFNQGLVSTVQKASYYVPNVDYATDMKTALALQNGIVTEKAPSRTGNRYITTLRDDPIQVGIQAAYILHSIKCPKYTGIQMGPNENSFIDYEILDIIDLISRASHISMLTTWYNKWSYFRLRPEAFGIAVEQTKNQNAQLGIHRDLLDSNVLDRIYQKYGSYLLPQAYPEGCPTHPSYPAGHATFSGAMTTILKAFFDENYEMESFKPNDDGTELKPLKYKLKVGDELDKLASNIATFRDAAGVHYPSDSIGILIGEHIAIELLKEHIQRYPRKTYFSFHKRNGEKVLIKNY